MVPVDAVAPKLTVPVPHREPAVDPLIVGVEFTVKEVDVERLLEFLYVIVTLPADTPETTPELLIVAILEFEDVQGVEECGVPDPESVDVYPAQADKVPVIVGNGHVVIEDGAVILSAIPVTDPEFCDENELDDK